MKALGYLLQYWALEFLGLVFRMLPPRLSRSLGAGLGSMAYALGIRREVALQNLRLVYPDAGRKWHRETALALYRNLGQNLSELLRFRSMSRADVLDIVQLYGAEHFDQALKAGRGALLITAHFGHWELYGAAIACAGYPLSVVVYPQHNRWVDISLNRLRQGKGVEVIYKREAAREILRALGRNRLVAVLIDQDAGGDGLFCDFLGHPASTPRGPALLAYKTGAPLIPGVIVRKEDGGHVGLVYGRIYADRSRPADEEVSRLTCGLNRILSDYIRQHPDHWYWVHRRWKSRPPDSYRS